MIVKYESFKWVYLPTNEKVTDKRDLSWLLVKFIHFFINFSPLSKTAGERCSVFNSLIKSFIFVPSSSIESDKESWCREQY